MVKMIINKKIYFLTAILFTVSIFPKLSNAEENIWREIKIIERTIEDMGTNVYWANDSKLCKEGLLGAYIPKEDIIYICQANHREDHIELLGTIKHEGWHAVQKKCNKDLAVLTDAQIRSHLKLRDRKILHAYHPQTERAEAEARVIEQIPTKPWIKGVKKLCS